MYLYHLNITNVRERERKHGEWIESLKCARNGWVERECEWKGGKVKRAFSTILCTFSFKFSKNDAKRTEKLITAQTKIQIYNLQTKFIGGSQTNGVHAAKRAVEAWKNGLSYALRKVTAWEIRYANTQTSLISLLSVVCSIAFIWCCCSAIAVAVAIADPDADAVVCNGKSSVLLS